MSSPEYIQMIQYTESDVLYMNWIFSSWYSKHFTSLIDLAHIRLYGIVTYG